MTAFSAASEEEKRGCFSFSPLLPRCGNPLPFLDLLLLLLLRSVCVSQWHPECHAGREEKEKGEQTWEEEEEETHVEKKER